MQNVRRSVEAKLDANRLKRGDPSEVVPLVLIANCYEHPERVVAIGLLLLGLGIGALLRSRQAARFFVENFLGPWRVNPGARAEHAETIDAWSSIVRWMLILLGIVAILIAVGTSVDAVAYEQ